MNDEAKVETAAVDPNAWTLAYPEVMRPVALRHGREVYEFTMQAGLVAEALGRIGRRQDPRTPHGKEILHACQMIATSMNALALARMTAGGITREAWQACDADIQAAAALRASTPPSNIILTH